MTIKCSNPNCRLPFVVQNPREVQTFTESTARILSATCPHCGKSTQYNAPK